MGDMKIFILIGIILDRKYCLLAVLITVITADIIGEAALLLKMKKHRDEIPSDCSSFSALWLRCCSETSSSTHI